MSKPVHSKNKILRSNTGLIINPSKAYPRSETRDKLTGLTIFQGVYDTHQRHTFLLTNKVNDKIYDLYPGLQGLFRQSQAIKNRFPSRATGTPRLDEHILIVFCTLLVSSVQVKHQGFHQSLRISIRSIQVKLQGPCQSPRFQVKYQDSNQSPRFSVFIPSRSSIKVQVKVHVFQVKVHGYQVKVHGFSIHSIQVKHQGSDLPAMVIAIDVRRQGSDLPAKVLVIQVNQQDSHLPSMCSANHVKRPGSHLPAMVIDCSVIQVKHLGSNRQSMVKAIQVKHQGSTRLSMVCSVIHVKHQGSDHPSMVIAIQIKRQGPDHPSMFIVIQVKHQGFDRQPIVISYSAIHVKRQGSDRPSMVISIKQHYGHILISCNILLVFSRPGQASRFWSPRYGYSSSLRPSRSSFNVPISRFMVIVLNPPRSCFTDPDSVRGYRTMIKSTSIMEGQTARIKTQICATVFFPLKFKYQGSDFKKGYSFITIWLHNEKFGSFQCDRYIHLVRPLVTVGFISLLASQFKPAIMDPISVQCYSVLAVKVPLLSMPMIPNPSPIQSDRATIKDSISIQYDSVFTAQVEEQGFLLHPRLQPRPIDPGLLSSRVTTEANDQSFDILLGSQQAFNAQLYIKGRRLYTVETKDQEPDFRIDLQGYKWLSLPINILLAV
ncbi:hypothetical protein F4703DRAFT_1962664 [Phycomyces blakesleeanus]